MCIYRRKKLQEKKILHLRFLGRLVGSSRPEKPKKWVFIHVLHVNLICLFYFLEVKIERINITKKAQINTYIRKNENNKWIKSLNCNKVKNFTYWFPMLKFFRFIFRVFIIHLNVVFNFVSIFTSFEAETNASPFIAILEDETFFLERLGTATTSSWKLNKQKPRFLRQEMWI